MNRGLVSDCCIIIQTTVNWQMSFLPSSWFTHPLTNWLSPMIVEALPETIFDSITLWSCVTWKRSEKGKYKSNIYKIIQILKIFPLLERQHNTTTVDYLHHQEELLLGDTIKYLSLSDKLLFLVFVPHLPIKGLLSLLLYCTEYSPRCRFVGLVVGEEATPPPATPDAPVHLWIIIITTLRDSPFPRFLNCTCVQWLVGGSCTHLHTLPLAIAHTIIHVLWPQTQLNESHPLQFIAHLKSERLKPRFESFSNRTANTSEFSAIISISTSTRYIAGSKFKGT